MLLTVYVTEQTLETEVLKGESFFALLNLNEARGHSVLLQVDIKNVEYEGIGEVYVNVKGAGVNE